jgi:hypothetical protein
MIGFVFSLGMVYSCKSTYYYSEGLKTPSITPGKLRTTA